MSDQEGACCNCRHFTAAKGETFLPNVGICTRDNLWYATLDSARPSCFVARNGARPASGGCADRAPAISASGAAR